MRVLLCRCSIKRPRALGRRHSCKNNWNMWLHCNTQRSNSVQMRWPNCQRLWVSACVSSWVLQRPQIVMSVSGSTWICRGPNSGPLRRVYVRMCMPFYNVNYKGFGRKTLGGPLGGILGWTLGGTPWMGSPWGSPWGEPWPILGGPLEDPRRTFGGPLPLRTTAENIPLPSDIRAAKVCVHVHRP